MRDYSEYTEYIVERTKELLGIDSPSGYTGGIWIFDGFVPGAGV